MPCRRSAAALTRPSACGTCGRAAACAPCPPTRIPSRRWTSARTVPSSPAPALTASAACGTCTTATASRRSSTAKARLSHMSASRPTVRASRPADLTTHRARAVLTLASSGACGETAVAVATCINTTAFLLQVSYHPIGSTQRSTHHTSSNLIPYFQLLLSWSRTT